MGAHDFDTPGFSPPTTPVQDYHDDVYPPAPPKIWGGPHISSPSNAVVDSEDDDDMDLPDTWYEVCSLYCTQCKHFEFAGNHDDDAPQDPTLVSSSVFDAVPNADAIVSATSGEEYPNTTALDAAATTTTHPATMTASITATTTTPTPATPAKSTALNSITAATTTITGADNNDDSPYSPSEAITPSSSPSRLRRRLRPQVRRRHCIGSPTLCCLPVGSSKSSVHLRCPKTPITTRSLRARGCRRCAASSDCVRVLRVRVQLAEMQYGVKSMRHLPHEIAHSLLVCEACKAIGFPGCSDRLTTIHEKYSMQHQDQQLKPSKVVKKSADLFYDTVSQSPLSINAWLSAFVHLPECTGESHLIAALPIRLFQSDMRFAYRALRHTTPLDQRPLAILEAEAHALQCRLEFSLRQSDMASATSQEELDNTCVSMTNFILSMREPPVEIFGCRALEMRVRICQMMRRKRQSVPNCWTRTVAQKFGILLRVFNTLCDEERMEED